MVRAKGYEWCTNDLYGNVADGREGDLPSFPVQTHVSHYFPSHPHLTMEETLLIRVIIRV